MINIAMYTSNCIFSGTDTGGIKRFRELMIGLSKKGYLIDLYSMDLTKSECNDYKSINHFSLNRARKLFFLPTELSIYIKNIKNINNLKKRKYDFVIVFDVPTCIGLSLSKVKNLHLFIRQDLIAYKKINLKHRYQSFYIVFLKICEIISIRTSKRVYVQCQYDLIELIKRHKFNKNLIQKKTKVQINNVNPSWIIDKSNSKEKISNFSSKKNYKICFIGNFDNMRKGADLFLKTIENLRQINNEFSVYLIGGGKKLAYYKSKYSNYIELHFLDHVENPIIYLKKCDILIVPSLADSCPNTIMESLYNNIPVLGAKSGGIPEILKNNDFLFEPNEKDLQRIISKYLNSESLSSIAKKQKVRKEELCFNWVDKIEKLMEL